MQRSLTHLYAGLFLLASVQSAFGQQSLTWPPIVAQVLQVNRDRYRLGPIAQVDLDRLELRRVQYETDLQTADVNLRTAKIRLLALLSDKTPVEQFDVTGLFHFSEQIAPLDEVRNAALASHPDLLAALLSIAKAKTDHRLAVANGSTGPTFGLSVSIPLRVFGDVDSAYATVKSTVSLLPAYNQRYLSRAVSVSEIIAGREVIQ